MALSVLHNNPFPTENVHFQMSGIQHPLYEKNADFVNSSEIEEVFKRLQTHKGTKGLIAATSDGVPIRSTMEDGPTHTYCALVQRLVSKCSQSLKELDPTDDLTFLRIRTAKNEIMVAPEANYFLIVVQENS